MSEGANPYAAPDLAAIANGGRVVSLTDPDGNESRYIDIELTADDLAGFGAFFASRSTAARAQRRTLVRLAAFNVGLLAILAWLRWVSEGSLGPAAYMALGLLALCAFALPPVQAFTVRRSVRGALATGRNLGVVGPRRVTLSSRGVRCEGPHTDEHTRWVAIEQIEASSEALYLFLSASTCHVVPRRAFASDAEFDAFVALARKYQAAAQVG